MMYLIVDEVDDGMLQHLRWLSQSLNGGHLIWMHLGGRNLHSLIHCLRKHGGADSLRSCLVQMLVHLCLKHTDVTFN